MKVPGIGEVKPVYVVGVGAAATGVVIYAYVRKRKTAGAVAGATDPSIDPSTGQPYANEVDPATGVPYSQEQGAQDAGAAFTPFGGIDPSTGVPYVFESGSNVGTGNANPILSNTDWVSTAQQELENSFGYSSATAQSAVRKYLGQKDSLTASEASGIQTVVAEIGPPPTGGPYRIITGAAPVPPSSSPVTVPACVGTTAGTAHNRLTAAHLVPVADPGQKATARVKSITPRAGSKVAPGTRVLITT